MSTHSFLLCKIILNVSSGELFRIQALIIFHSQFQKGVRNPFKMAFDYIVGSILSPLTSSAFHNPNITAPLPFLNFSNFDLFFTNIFFGSFLCIRWFGILNEEYVERVIWESHNENRWFYLVFVLRKQFSLRQHFNCRLLALISDF